MALAGRRNRNKETTHEWSITIMAFCDTVTDPTGMGPAGPSTRRRGGLMTLVVAAVALFAVAAFVLVTKPYASAAESAGPYKIYYWGGYVPTKDIIRSCESKGYSNAHVDNVEAFPEGGSDAYVATYHCGND